MTFRLLDSLSLPGDPQKPNEDSFAHLDRAALVLDGATPLGPPLLPGPSDAHWIAQFGARRLAAHLKDGDAPVDALRHALTDAEKSFAGLARHPIKEKWQTPCASMMMVAFVDPLRPSRARERAMGTSPASANARGGGGPDVGKQIQLLWFGDCAALIEQNGQVELVGEALDKRKAEAARARLIAQEKKLPSALGVGRPEIEPLLRAARGRINSGRHWLFSPDPRAAAHASRHEINVTKGAKLLIVSDGFLALISDYNVYDAASLMRRATDKGLSFLGEELRAVENDDAEGRKFSRFKKSDDATALLLEII